MGHTTSRGQTSAESLHPWVYYEERLDTLFLSHKQTNEITFTPPLEAGQPNPHGLPFPALKPMSKCLALGSKCTQKQISYSILFNRISLSRCHHSGVKCSSSSGMKARRLKGILRSSGQQTHPLSRSLSVLAPQQAIPYYVLPGPFLTLHVCSGVQTLVFCPGLFHTQTLFKGNTSLPTRCFINGSSTQKLQLSMSVEVLLVQWYPASLAQTSWSSGHRAERPG